MEGMFRSQEAQKAAETLISHIDVMKTDLRVVQSQCPGDMLQLEEHNDDIHPCWGFGDYKVSISERSKHFSRRSELF